MTFNGLSKWYKKLFEKLGWMILASHHGKDEKIKEYIRFLEHFLISAEDKYKHTQSKDINDNDE